MARARPRPVLSVAQAFVRCQEGVSGHAKYAALSWQAVLADQEAGWHEFRRCIDLLLCAPQVLRSGPLRLSCFLSTCDGVQACHALRFPSVR